MKAIAIFLMLVSAACADNCRNVVRQNVIVNDVGLAVVPFAIATPVATVVPGTPMYSYNATAAAYQSRATAQSDEQALYREFLEWRAKRAAVTAQAEPVSPFAQTCVKCHSQGGSGFAHHDFSKPLTDGDKLKAIKAVMVGKMPPKRVLEPQVRSDVIAELSGVNEVKAAVVPQQPQPPSENQK